MHGKDEKHNDNDESQKALVLFCLDEPWRYRMNKNRASKKHTFNIMRGIEENCMTFHYAVGRACKVLPRDTIRR